MKVLLPASWSQLDYTEPALSEVYTDAEVWVEGWNAVHGHAPFTLQPEECGEEGLYIQVSRDYLTDHASSFSDIFGPPGQVFLHEWARLRYGVFEEHGYPGDPIYPAFYQQQTWTAEGPQVEVKPAFCTDRQVEGELVDVRPGRECEYDTATGLPDHNCYFFATGPEDLDSSVMALPYLKGNDHFCENGEEHIHHPDLPNKHNAMCGGRSVFDVVRQHPDFTDYSPQPDQNNTNPTFTYLQPRPTQKYVMVLDASMSMGENQYHPDRRNRLKKAAARFITYGIENEVPLGVVKFSANTPDETKIIYPVTPITDENRQDAIKSINDIELSLQTCLGDGLLKGLEALSDFDQDDGGVMFFLTDGKFKCDDGPTIGDVIEDVVKQNVRVITVAFGDKAGPDIETLAERTNGAAFFVPDGSGPGPLNDAFSDLMEYQPEGPYKERSVTVMQETISEKKEITRDFTIDGFSGREVVLEMDISCTENVQISVSAGDISLTFKPEDEVFQQKYPSLEPGNYTMQLNSTKAMDKVTLKVQSKAPEGSNPLTSRCWTSMGGRDVDLVAKDKVVVLAEVRQGQSPVVGARVLALVDRDDGQDPVKLVLLDNGAGADRVAGDGLYAGFFTQYVQSDADARYSLRCSVEGTEDSSTHGGSPGSRSLPSRPSEENPLCCGSTALREDSILTPTGAFTRSQVGGLISVLPTGDISNIYPPGKITDLRLGDMDFDRDVFDLNFTFSGEDLDQGTVESYTIFYASNKTLLNGDDDLSPSVDQLKPGHLAGCSPTSNCSLPSPLAAGEMLGLELAMEAFPKDRQIFWRVRVEDEGGKWAMSNIATSYLHDVKATDAGGAASRTRGGAGIVTGLTLLFLVSRARQL